MIYVQSQTNIIHLLDTFLSKVTCGTYFTTVILNWAPESHLLGLEPTTFGVPVHNFNH